MLLTLAQQMLTPLLLKDFYTEDGIGSSMTEVLVSGLSYPEEEFPSNFLRVGDFFFFLPKPDENNTFPMEGQKIPLEPRKIVALAFLATAEKDTWADIEVEYYNGSTKAYRLFFPSWRSDRGSVALESSYSYIAGHRVASKIKIFFVVTPVDPSQEATAIILPYQPQVKVISITTVPAGGKLPIMISFKTAGSLDHNGILDTFITLMGTTSGNFTLKTPFERLSFSLQFGEKKDFYLKLSKSASFFLSSDNETFREVVLPQSELKQVLLPSPVVRRKSIYYIIQATPSDSNLMVLQGLVNRSRSNWGILLVPSDPEGFVEFFKKYTPAQLKVAEDPVELIKKAYRENIISGIYHPISSRDLSFSAITSYAPWNQDIDGVRTYHGNIGAAIEKATKKWKFRGILIEGFSYTPYDLVPYLNLLVVRADSIPRDVPPYAVAFVPEKGPFIFKIPLVSLPFPISYNLCFWMNFRVPSQYKKIREGKVYLKDFSFSDFETNSTFSYLMSPSEAYFFRFAFAQKPGYIALREDLFPDSLEQLFFRERVVRTLTDMFSFSPVVARSKDLVKAKLPINLNDPAIVYPAIQTQADSIPVASYARHLKNK